MNSVTVCRKTLEYPLATIYETQYSVSGEDGAFSSTREQAASLIKELIDAGVFSVDFRVGEPLVILTRHALGSDQEALVLSILSRYYIHGGVLQAEWLAGLQPVVSPWDTQPLESPNRQAGN